MDEVMKQNRTLTILTIIVLVVLFGFIVSIYI